MLSTFSRFVLVLLVTFVCFATGCGDGNPTTYPVAGMVKYSDGVPLSGGTIEFETQTLNPKVTARGEIQPDGSFQLGTYKSNDGALPGLHKVAIIPKDGASQTNMEERPGANKESSLHPRYRRIKTSGIEKTVNQGKNEFEIIVEYRD